MDQQITLKRLSVESLHDFLDYFDHRAFLEDPNWRGCYCQFYFGTQAEELPLDQKIEQNRALACSRVETGEMDGYLLYSGEKVIAWCAAASSLLFPGLPGADEKLARILCFNIDPDLRGQGMAGKMLDLVLQELAGSGFELVEAGPNEQSYGDKSYRGSLKMFTDRGFEQITSLGDGFVLVRKYLS